MNLRTRVLFAVFLTGSFACLGCAQRSAKGEFSETELLSSKKTWMSWTVISTVMLKFEKDGRYIYKSGPDTIRGKWTVRDGILTLTGVKVLDKTKTKLVDADAAYKIEWLEGRKRFKLHFDSSAVAGTVSKNQPSMSLNGTTFD